MAVSPATVASPAQVRIILAEVSRNAPKLAAFFGCLCYEALRPEEAAALRRDDLNLPGRGCSAAPGARRPVAVAERHPEPAEFAARAGPSAGVLHEVYLHCISSQHTPSASRSKPPSTWAPASRSHHGARKRAVTRTVGTTPTLSAMCP